jgi:tetratricopeptide (TPR) repeat protein
MDSRHGDRKLRDAGKVSFLFAALCLISSCARSLPDFPQLDLGRFQSEIRRAVAQQADQAKANPRDANQVLRLGMVLHAHDQFQAAAQCYARAHSLSPKRFETLYCWGQALASMGDYRGSAERLRQALAIRPRSVPARLKLAEVLRESAESASSAELYRQVLNETPEDATAHYGLGRLLDGAEAITEFRKALALFPRYGAAQFALATAYRKIGETEKAQEALSDYTRDKTLIPPLDDPEMAAVRALNLSATGLLSQAAELEKEGRLEEALERHNRAIAMDPKLVDAYVNLISLYGRLQRNVEAEQAYHQAIALDPNRAEAYYNFGVFCFERQRLSEAKTAFERAVRLNPRHAEALHNCAVIWEREGKWEQAAALYHRALEVKPSYPLAHFHLGRLYANQNRYALAIQEFERSLEPPGAETPTYLYALAATNARAGARGRAVELMRQARAQAFARGQTALAASIDHDLAALAP